MDDGGGSDGATVRLFVLTAGLSCSPVLAASFDFSRRVASNLFLFLSLFLSLSLSLFLSLPLSLSLPFFLPSLLSFSLPSFSSSFLLSFSFSSLFSLSLLFFLSNNDNDHSSSRLSLCTHGSDLCQSACTLAHSLFGEHVRIIQETIVLVLLCKPRATWNEVGLYLYSLGTVRGRVRPYLWQSDVCVNPNPR